MKVKKKSDGIYVDNDSQAVRRRRNSQTLPLESIGGNIFARKDRKNVYYVIDSKGDVIDKKGDLPDIDNIYEQ